MSFPERLLTHAAILSLIAVAAVVAGVAVWIDHHVAGRPPAAGPDGRVRRGPRPAAPACEPDYMTPAAWTGVPSAAEAPDALVVLLGNNGDTRCTLAGEPGLIAHTTDAAVDAGSASGAAVADGAGGGAHPDPAVGRWVRVPTEEAALPIDPVAQFPGTVDGGEPARVVITPALACRTPTRYTDLALVVGKRIFPVGGVGELTACSVRVGTWHVIPPLLEDVA